MFLRFICFIILFVSTYPAVASSFSKAQGALVTSDACYDLSLEVANTPAQRAQGLMFRATVPEGTGMLLDYGHTQHVTLWMKNTFVPLDMLFIDASGLIRHIHTGAVPHALEHISSRYPVRYALELNAGFVSKHGIEQADRFMMHACKDVKAYDSIPDNTP